MSASVFHLWRPWEPKASKAFTSGSAGRSGSRSLFFVILNPLSIGIIEREFSGAMKHRQLAIWVFMDTDTRFDVVISVAIRWDLQAAIFIAHSVVFSLSVFLLANLRHE